MSQQMPFIGRKEELKQIDNFITKWGTRRVLCIDGPGGIGKTRLLAEIQRLYTNYEQVSLLVADILDFDDRSLHLAENIKSQMARQLDEQAFGSYLRRIVDLRKSANAGVSPQTLKEDREHIDQIFLGTFNQLSQNRRLVLLLDTTEKLESKEVWNRIIDFIVEANNSLFVLAGRNAKELWQRLDSKLADDAQLIELQAFEEEFGLQYLDEKQRILNVNIGPELEPKLLLLTGGRAILLDLAAEWLSRDLPLSWMTQKALEGLQALSEEEMAEHKKDFEIQLVRHIQQIRDQMARLILMMSRVYPLTSAMIVQLLRRSPEQADALFDYAQTYVFVKSLPDGSISLHDEMRRMVNEYVWPEVDPDELRRRRDSKLAAQLFESEEEQLKKRLTELRQTTEIELAQLFEREALLRRREVVNEQQIEHALYSDVDLGFQVWKKIVQERRTANEFTFAMKLLNIAQPYSQLFNSEIRFEFNILAARLTSDTGRVREAKNILNQLLTQNLDRQDRKASIYNALGLVEEKLGNLQLARDYQLECLKLVDQKFYPPVANRVGYLHRQLGELQEAVKYYSRGLNTALKKGKTEEHNKHLIASLLNNLGYVYVTQGNYFDAAYHCNEAIEIWQDSDYEREIGRAETVLSVLYRKQGDFKQALTLLHNAINRYQEPDDHEKLTSAYFHLGLAQWYQADKADEEVADIRLLGWDEDLLEQAISSYQKSQELAERYGLEVELPAIWHHTAVSYWYLGHVRNNDDLRDKARQLNKKSYEKSQEIGDIRYTIDNLLANVAWDYDIREYDKIPKYAQQLAEYEDKEYPLFFGRMRRIEADIAFEKEDFETAFSKYAQGLALINQHGGFGRYSIERELSRLGNKMENKLPPIEIEKWIKYLREEWENKKDQDTNLLTTWCRQRLLRTKLRSMRSIEW